MSLTLQRESFRGAVRRTAAAPCWNFKTFCIDQEVNRMDGVKTEPMSAGELKARLYQTFRERGLVESLKSQLRTKLVTELRQSAALQQVKFSPSSATRSHDASSSLMLRAANSLVVDHLRRCGFDYSMAVFLPESGSSEDKMFTVSDLLDLMRIVPGSKLHKKLSSELPRYDSKGFLWQLLTELSSGHGIDQRDVGVQAETHPPFQSSIERKLQSVDEVYNEKRAEDDVVNKHAIQEKLLKMRREIETRSREETNREILRFKESELKRVELEERERARKEIASARREIENTYQAKSDALRERENAAMERIHKHQELIEKETYAQRQSLLEELRVIKQREADMRRESEVNSRAAKMEEDKRKAVEENLRLREASVTNIEMTYEKRLKEETKRFELEYEARVTERMCELEQREAKIRSEQRSMNEERETIKSLQEHLGGKTRHIEELEELLKQAKSETTSAVNRSEFLNERMRTMVDYPSLKEDNTILRRDLEHAKMRISELSGDFKLEQSRHEELIKQLSEKMSRPSPELLALRSELEQAKEALQHEKATVQHMETQWKARLQEEMEANRDLRHRLSEQTNEMASLMRQMADLKLALRQTETALNNNIHLAERSRNHGMETSVHNSTMPDDMYIDTTLHRTNVDTELLLAESGRYRPSLLDDSNSSDGMESSGESLAIIEQTKARFRQLEREAEHLEQNYQDLQHRMSGVGGLYRSPFPAASGPPGGAHLLPSVGVTRSTLHDSGASPPLGGSRQLYKEPSVTSPASKYHRKHPNVKISSDYGKTPSQSAEQGTYNFPGSLDDVFMDDKDGEQSVSDQRNTESLIPGKLPLSPLSSSPSSMSRGLRNGDARDDKTEEGRTDERKDREQRTEQDRRLDEQRMEEERRDKQRKSDEERVREERRREEQRSEDERRREEKRAEEQRKQLEERRIEEEKRREETRSDGGKRKENLDRKQEEDERRQREEERKRREEERRRQEEEETRAWEERRRQKEEERRRKEQEAREREQRMLMELQKQEQGNSGGAQAPDPRSKDGQNVQEEKMKEEEKEEEGIKIDPMMQRYMMMVQQRKQQEPTTPATQGAEVIPDSPAHSVKSDGTFSLEEMDGGVDEETSGGNVSDKDDPFDDW